MTKKNLNGQPSIYQRTDGRWSTTISIGIDEKSNKPIRKTIYGKTKNDVLYKLDEIKKTLEESNKSDFSNVTLSQWLDIWLYDYIKPSIRPTTFSSYESISRIHIKPHIGHLLLKDLKAEHIQRLFNEKANNGRYDGLGGLSTRTIKYIHFLIKSALSQAIKMGFLDKNVAEATVLPRMVKKDIRVLTLIEQSKFLSTVAGDRLSAAFILDLSTGLRQGELLALKWGDINFEENYIRVRRTIIRTNIFNKDKESTSQLIFQDPKTKAGKRFVPYPDNISNVLSEHKHRQISEKIKAGSLYEDNDFVFCTELGKPIEPRNFTRKFYKLAKKAGLQDINLHALRHTYATRLLEMNEHPKVVQELLGHSSITVTLDIYSHVMPEIKKSAANKLNKLFKDCI
ncbi:MAG: site-specific integrase [Lutispora sp.]|nr:site-specific integrase [Lutispora sp.]